MTQPDELDKQVLTFIYYDMMANHFRKKENVDPIFDEMFKIEESLSDIERSYLHSCRRTVYAQEPPYSVEELIEFLNDRGYDGREVLRQADENIKKFKR